jgi:heme-degrading monooxygenase HmoA
VPFRWTADGILCRKEASMGKPYSSGVWIAKAGRETEFAGAWREFAEWSLATIEGAEWAKLLQDRSQSNRFVSFGPWDSLDAMDAWRAHPGFAERVGRIRELIESLEPSTLEAVVEVGDIS